jgi:hypothetical protein
LKKNFFKYNITTTKDVDADEIVFPRLPWLLCYL